MAGLLVEDAPLNSNKALTSKTSEYTSAKIGCYT
jgi:hypothetical protein